MGLPPVTLDEGAATRAGQAHADDMATHGYLGHWGTDGSVPEQRFTAAGGTDMVLENASCFTDEHARKLDRAPLIDPKNIEQAEDMFFHETPPHDGHRKNILKPWHKTVGIGIAQPVATPTEIPVPVHRAGVRRPLRDVPAGAAQRACGRGPARRRDDRRAGDVRGRRPGADRRAEAAAGVGAEPAGARTPSRRRTRCTGRRASRRRFPVKVSGSQFAIDVPLSDGGKPGLYELSVWATFPGSQDFVMVSLRAIQVKP